MPWITAIKVESLGRQSAVTADKRYRFSTGVPTGAGADASLYIPCMTTLPSEVKTSISFRDGRSTLGGQNIELLAIDDVTTRLFRGIPRSVGLLAEDLTPTATTCSIVDASSGATLSGLAGYDVIIEREAISLVSEADGVYTITRAQFSTVATAHGASATDDREVFLSEHGPNLAARAVELVRMPADGGPDDEETLFVGILRRVAVPKSQSEPTVRVEVDSILGLLSKRELCGDLWKWSLAEAGPHITYLGASAGEAADGPSYDLTDGDGRRVLLSIAGQAAVDQYWQWQHGSGPLRGTGGAVLHATSTADMQASRYLEGSPDIDLTKLKSKFANEFFTGHADAPDLNDTGLRLSDNAVTAVLQVLTTTIDGLNGEHDLGDSDWPRRGRNLGCNVPVGLIDVAAMKRVRARLGPRAFLDRIQLGFDGKPVNAYQWIRDLLTPLGVVLTIGRGALLTLVMYQDSPPLGTVDISEGEITTIESQQDREADLVDSVITTWAWELRNEGDRTDSFDDLVRQRRRLTGAHKTTELKVYSSDELAVRRLVVEFLQQFRYALRELKIILPRTQSLWPGELIQLTHRQAFSTVTGLRGLYSETMLILGRRASLADAQISYLMLDVGALYDRRGLIAPSSEVASWDAGALTATVETDSFTAEVATDDAVQDDLDGWIVGDMVQLVARDHSVIDAGPFEIVAIGATTIELGSAPSPAPADGNLLIPAAYDSALSDQWALWAWIANAAGTLGATPHIAYQWTH